MTPRVVSLRKLLNEHTAPAAPELVRDEGDSVLRCLACGHRCRIAPDHHGVCHVRFNRNGELRVPSGYVSSLGVDPLEKKPFYHVMPGAPVLTFGMLGCNFHCPFCQNWVTSQTLRDAHAIAEPHFITAERIVALAVERGCPVLTSTYNEPLITTEWAVEIFKLGKQAGLIGSYVSNGNATPEVLEYMRPYVQLCNVDLKAFRDKTYRKLGGALDNVLNTIRLLKKLDFWVEVITLVVPGWNDSDEELTQIADFLVEVSPDIPWHVTAFRPDYHMTDTPPTPVETLQRAYEIGQRAGVRFVYAGNLPGMVDNCENTYCPQCHEELIVRYGFYVQRNAMRGSSCPSCGTRIPGVWQTGDESGRGKT
jgi:pyruvate formate lyase activating enzyme